MRMKSKGWFMGIIILLLTVFIMSNYAIADDWYEDELGYYTIKGEEGDILGLMGREIFVDDEYITENNRYYRISSIDKDNRIAIATYIDDIELPEIEEVAINGSTCAVDTLSVVAPNEDAHVLIYCTHSDESYVPSDGTPSIVGSGGILDVAQSFNDALKSQGVNVQIDKTCHAPHDAGAYRRSRNTAIRLIKTKQPVAALFDVHRDAVPKEQYDINLAGQPATRVRIVIGRRNQNRQANQELAYKIKAVADKTYPGLIKDIYIGKGMYNQELSPRSLLFEIGTYENNKEAAQTSAKFLADVVSKSLFGGTIKSVEKPTKEYKTTPITYEKSKGQSKGILWLVVILAIGIVGYMFISSGGRELKAKILGSRKDGDNNK